MGDSTKPRQVRVADGLWKAYDTVCKDLGRTRAEDINDHIRRQVRQHGGPEELTLLEQAEAEVAERRSRQVGHRPDE
ncbi:hypothetical protein [Actinosynnema sp. NPDC023587]|uniref:hypothetical protein n=1 Tax=Actinosynnema sp. NPDC023587 TaxID=3154695 RepID=UPI0033EA1FA3